MQMICFEIFLEKQMGVICHETVSVVQYEKMRLLNTLL